jgi:hypothetical protein
MDASADPRADDPAPARNAADIPIILEFGLKFSQIISMPDAEFRFRAHADEQTLGALGVKGPVGIDV